MDAELQNINQGMTMKVKEEIFETSMEIDDHEKQLSNEFSQDCDTNENFETDDNIYVSENSEHGKVKLIEIIKVRQDHEEQISDLKDRSYLDDSNYKSTELTNEKNDFVIKTEIPSGDMEAGCSYHENSNIAAEDSYVKVNLKPESDDRTNKETDVKLENSGSFMASLDHITKNDFQNISSDQSHLGSYNPPHKYENGSQTQYELGQDSISCRVVSSNRADGGNHTMKHSSTERTHQCGICNKGFKMKENLRNHMISHSTETAYQCNICKSRFKDKYHLNVHMTRHDTKRLHKCDMCKKGFKTAGDLRSHLKQHTTDRPHQCNMCEMRFKTMNELRSHMKYHTTDRPHQCNMCNKGFKTIYLFRQHSLSHSSDRPHRCNVCDKGFKTVYALRRHMERSQLHDEATSELGKDSRS